MITNIKLTLLLIILVQNTYQTVLIYELQLSKFCKILKILIETCNEPLRTILELWNNSIFIELPNQYSYSLHKL